MGVEKELVVGVKKAKVNIKRAMAPLDKGMRMFQNVEKGLAHQVR